MGIHTTIQWCDSTVNPTQGCDGCELWDKKRGGICYAARIHARFADTVVPAPPEERLKQPFSLVLPRPGRMAKAAAFSDLRGQQRPDKPWLDGAPRVIFVGDMGDVFSHAIKFKYLRDEILGAMRSEQGRRHFWIVMTKRTAVAAKFAKWLRGSQDTLVCPNMMLMTSITSPLSHGRAAHLASTARQGAGSCYRGISVEPMLGPVRWQHLAPAYPRWVVVGMASGPGAPVGQANWVRQLVEDCRFAHVPIFVKQLGKEIKICAVGAPPMKGRVRKPGDDEQRRLKFEDSKGGNPCEWPFELQVRQMPDCITAMPRSLPRT